MDQQCRFRDLVVKDLQGSVMYQSNLNNPSVLADFGIGWNQYPWLSDGAKRDRIPRTADVLTSGRSLYYSTYGVEYVRGTIVAAMQREADSSLLAGACPSGMDLTRDGVDGLFTELTVNYSFYLIVVVFDYWMHMGDDSILRISMGKIEAFLDSLNSKTNSQRLLSVEGSDGKVMHYIQDCLLTRISPRLDYYNKVQEGVSTKRNALYVAVLRAVARMLDARGPTQDLSRRDSYLSKAEKVTAAIRSCFDPEAGHYIITDKWSGFQQEAHAWLVLQDIATSEQLSQIWHRFRSLGDASKGGSPTSFAPGTEGVTPVVSPIMSALHFEAAVHASHYEHAGAVLRSVWGPMADTSGPNFTSTTWEFMSADGTPYRGNFCSLAQAFSSGPTYLLPRFVLGVEPIEPGFRAFRVEPRLQITGLRWAEGRVPTPLGLPIVTRWEFVGSGQWSLNCLSPVGLKGQLIIPLSLWDKRYKVLLNESDDVSSNTIPFESNVTITVWYR